MRHTTSILKENHKMLSHEQLTGLTIKELNDLQSRVKIAHEEVHINSRKVALIEISEVAEKHGFLIEELFGASVPKKRAAPVPKYRNPNDTSVTWAGKGRHPGWIKEAMQAGTDVETFRI
jgi:DNA-binding protein H-NS